MLFLQYLVLLPWLLVFLLIVVILRLNAAISRIEMSLVLSHQKLSQLQKALHVCSSVSPEALATAAAGGGSG